MPRWRRRGRGVERLTGDAGPVAGLWRPIARPASHRHDASLLAGLAGWSLKVLGADFPGRWVIASTGGLCQSRARQLETTQDCARADMSFCRVLSSQPRSRVSGKAFTVLSLFSGFR